MKAGSVRRLVNGASGFRRGELRLCVLLGVTSYTHVNLLMNQFAPCGPRRPAYYHHYNLEGYAVF